MCGNLREWTSSLAEPYPYDATDGREADGEIDSSGQRVTRGGTFLEDGEYLDTTTRSHTFHPYTMLADIGFRCVRAYDE